MSKKTKAKQATLEKPRIILKPRMVTSDYLTVYYENEDGLLEAGRILCSRPFDNLRPQEVYWLSCHDGYREKYNSAQEAAEVCVSHFLLNRWREKRHKDQDILSG